MVVILVSNLFSFSGDEHGLCCLRYVACSGIIQGVKLETSVKIHQLVSHRLLQISESSLT